MKRTLSIACALTLLSFASYAKEPQLTQVEQLQLENLSLKQTNIKLQLSQIDSEYQVLRQQIEKENPGYILNPSTGQLQKRPEPPTATPAPSEIKKP